MKALSDYPDAHLRQFVRPPVPDVASLRSVYLIAICGTGMGSMAAMFREAGFAVSGSDEAVYPPMSERLAELGIPVHIGFDPANLQPHPDLVIVGNACTPTHVEAAYARDNGLPQMSFPEALAHYFIRDRRSIVVAGTHGKTSTTGLLIHVFQTAGLDPGYLVGGISQTGESGQAVGTRNVFITEGDEYDSAYFDKEPKLFHYRPDVAIVTSVEFDHADIYDGIEDYTAVFERFAAGVSKEGRLIVWGDDPRVKSLARWAVSEVTTYGVGLENGVRAANVVIDSEGQSFDVYSAETLVGRFKVPAWGRHNLLNTLAVVAVSVGEGIDPESINRAFASYQGMKRRQEIRGEVGGITVVDDFAHHPTAVRETILGIRDRWPDRRIVAVFEPRTNSSRRKVFEAPYGRALAGADVVFLSSPPLRYNDDPADFRDAKAVADAVNGAGVRIGVWPSPDELLGPLISEVKTGDVVLIMSNGAVGNLHRRLLDVLAESKR
jgi:UDP-N-acetylmuramate: L-alanyl-gamma-D-glutamyl-meso-diaminopimelate ligase